MIAVQMKVQSARNNADNSVALAEQSVGMLRAAKLTINKTPVCETLLELADDNLGAAIRDLEAALTDMRLARTILNEQR